MGVNGIDGLVSGLDTTALIDAMVAARSGPVSLLERRRSESTAQLSAWKSFEAILVSMKIEADRLSDGSLWNTPSVTSSDEDILSAVGSSNAVLDKYELFVVQLAQAHQIRSVAYASRDDLVGSGTLSVTVGTDTVQLSVAAGTAVEDLVELINDADLGATASLVKSVEAGVESYTIVLTSDETGEGNAISIVSTLTGGTEPDFDAVDAEIRAAQDAIIEFGGEGGLQIHSATNTFTDLIDGVDVTVRKAQASGDGSVTVEIARNVDSIVSVMEQFVDRYNSVMEFVNGQFRYDPKVGERPPLLGNSTLTGISGTIRSRLFRSTANLPGSAAFRSLLDVGLSAASNGGISFDATEFREAMEESFSSVADLFRLNATFDQTGFELLNAPAGIDLAARELEIAVSQVASRATLTGAQFDLTASGLVVDDTNDAFKIEIDGVLSEELTLAHGTYTDGDTLARAIQNAVDGSEDLGSLGVRVSFEDGGGTLGNLVFTSNRFGSHGSITLLNPGGDFLGDLGLYEQRNVKHVGQDVVATIDGVTITGEGRVLRVGDGEIEGLEGLEIRVLLGAGDSPLTTTASFTEGMARSLTRALSDMTDSTAGTLKRVGDTVQGQIDRYDRDLQAKVDQLDRYRETLVRRYAKLESTLGQLQSQGNFVAAQLGSLQSFSDFNKK